MAAQTDPPVPSFATSAEEVPRRVGQASRSGWVERVGSLGFAAKGVLYLTIGAIAASVGVVTGSPSGASQTGAIQQLSQQPHGTAILLVLTVGLAGYALLRAVHVVANPGGESGAKGIVMRLSYLIRAVVYGGLTVYATSVLSSGGEGSSDGETSRQATARALELPYGQWLVGVVALVLAGMAVYQVRTALTRGFMDQIHAVGFRQAIARWSGTIGHAARGVLFGTVAVLLARAALQSDASESGGLSHAFRELASTTAGTSLLLVIAVGVAGYGVFCLAMAAWGTARVAE